MPRPEPTDVPQKPVVDIKQSGLGQKFLKAIARRQELKLLEKEIAAELEGDEGLNKQILNMMAVAGHECIATPDWKVTMYSSNGPSSIDKKILLEKGVSVAIIQAATKKGKSYETIQVTSRKNERENTNEQ